VRRLLRGSGRSIPLIRDLAANREGGGAHAVPRMWKSQTNEDGMSLSKLARDALIERHCEPSAPGRNKQLGVYCSFHAEKRLLSVSIKTVTCPDCKLVVPVRAQIQNLDLCPMLPIGNVSASVRFAATRLGACYGACGHI